MLYAIGIGRELSGIHMESRAIQVEFMQIGPE